jgi:hypothetical protein
MSEYVDASPERVLSVDRDAIEEALPKPDFDRESNKNRWHRMMDARFSRMAEALRRVDGWAGSQHEWAELHGLKESRREPCWCGLLRKDHYSAHGETVSWPHGQVRGSKYKDNPVPDGWGGGHHHEVMDHPTLYQRGGKPAFLIAHPYNSRLLVRQALQGIDLDRWGISWWVGDERDALSFYYPGATVPIIYAAPGFSIADVLRRPHERTTWLSAAYAKADARA